MDNHSKVCWFVQKHVDGNFDAGWNLNDASEHVLVKQFGGKN
ncbi:MULTISPECIES: hypothetical protein [Bacillus cereus group]|nr:MULTISPECIES: hypothetical protein [Bacillus cereus group]